MTVENRSWASRAFERLARYTEFWMFSIAFWAILGTIVIALWAVSTAAKGELVDGVLAFLGSVVTGLIFIARDVVNAIKARWGVQGSEPTEFEEEI